MTADYDKLWNIVRSIVDEGESVRTLVKILSSKDGRTFILNLEPSEAELCIEILDHVSTSLLTICTWIWGGHSPMQ